MMLGQSDFSLYVSVMLKRNLLEYIPSAHRAIIVRTGLWLAHRCRPGTFYGWHLVPSENYGKSLMDCLNEDMNKTKQNQMNLPFDFVSVLTHKFFALLPHVQEFIVSERSFPLVLSDAARTFTILDATVIVLACISLDGYYYNTI